MFEIQLVRMGINIWAWYFSYNGLLTASISAREKVSSSQKTRVDLVFNGHESCRFRYLYMRLLVGYFRCSEESAVAVLPHNQAELMNIDSLLFAVVTKTRVTGIVKKPPTWMLGIACRVSLRSSSEHSTCTQTARQGALRSFDVSPGEACISGDGYMSST